MGKQMKLKLLFVMGVLLLLGIGGIYWYFAVHAKTPGYSVQVIEKAIEKHDKTAFHRYVDVDALLDNTYDDLVYGMMDSGQPMTEESKVAVEDIVRVLKAPLITSLKTSIDQYVTTGAWDASSDSEASADESLDIHQVLVKSGIGQTNFRAVDSVAIEEKETAIAKVRVYQKEAEAEFTLEVLLRQTERGDWRVEDVRNFHDFVVFVGHARQAEIVKYMELTADIMAKHDKSMRDADFDFQRILGEGSLGKQGTRDELKRFMEGRVAKDWKTRREELEAVNVPEEAQSLHRLRLRICDLHIAYAEGYGRWMEDKQASTIREADAKLKQARTLEQEARFLAKRMGGSPNDI